MTTDFLIRSERPSDHDAIEALIDRSLEDELIARGTETDFVREVRDSDRYIQALSLVAMRDGEPIGFCMVSRTVVADGLERHPTLLLHPIVTAPEWRGQGIGAALVHAAMGRARDMGFGTVFVAGGHRYYEHLGFQPTHLHQITCQYDMPASVRDNILVRELIPGTLREVRGIVFI